MGGKVYCYFINKGKQPLLIEGIVYFGTASISSVVLLLSGKLCLQPRRTQVATAAIHQYQFPSVSVEFIVKCETTEPLRSPPAGSPGRDDLAPREARPRPHLVRRAGRLHGNHRLPSCRWSWRGGINCGVLLIETGFRDELSVKIYMIIC